ncbi:MAG: transcriptional regulator, TetR family [Solirubrobacterales bacterium]|nr:transcriptional regulator, TetR family [Solirubrobacterales bacterium]
MPDGPAIHDPRRERLLQGVVAEVTQAGYQATTIAQITARAGVSRTTFYEHFSDKQDCFLAAYRELAGRLLETVERALEETPAPEGTRAILGVLVELAERQPADAVVLTHGAAAAGLPALHERDRLLASIEQAVERAWKDAPKQAPSPSLPARALVGGAVRELAVHLHRREPPGELLAELIRWAERYTQRTPPSWRSAGASQAPARTSTSRQRPAHKTARRRPARLTAHERIVRAVAEVAQRNGHPQVTVADIAAAAGVNRETFYQHFTDRQSAYVAAIQLAFERTMAATAGAFFGRPDWTERVWNGAHGLVEFLADERALAHVALAEPYAVGPAATELIIDLQFAFTLFLEEGYRRPGAERTPGLTSTLIVGGVLELLDRRLRERPEDGLAVLVPEIAYLALAPFIGADAAGEFVERKLAETPVSETA